MLPSNKPGQFIGDGAGGRSNNSARKLIHHGQTQSTRKRKTRGTVVARKMTP